MRALAHLRRSAALAAAITAALLVLVPSSGAAQKKSAVRLTMNVVFTYTGDISVTLPDGTPVSNARVIPAGYYSLLLSGPGACTLVPYFMLNGPGVALTDNMDQGEEEFLEYVVEFLPNSTYTWRNGDQPTVLHTFQTSAQVVGTKAPPVAWTGPVTSKSSNKDIVGSGLLPGRGALAAGVSKSGQISLAYKGKSVATLRPGRYSLTVVDSSSKGGFFVQPFGKKVVSLTNAAFVGKRSVTIELNKGKWLFMTSAKGAGTTVTVK